MPFINIHTNNQSRELTNATTFVDNWVYVPGTAITGDPYKVYAFKTLDDFKNACGTNGPEGSKTFKYVSGILNAGLPVLFRRIAYIDQDTGSELTDGNESREGNVKRAKTNLVHTDAETTSEVIDVTVYEKYGGTFGNDMYVTVRNTGSAYWLDVFVKDTALEKVKLISYNSTTETKQEINQKLITALSTIEFERIVIDVVNTDVDKFALNTVTRQRLSGGADFDESLVSKEIARSFKFIKDKILYQPKFITSGGYTDTLEEIETAENNGENLIATAMKNLTLQRQDCRALIDLPLGTTSEEYQTLAESLSYQQLSDSQIIPSASICGPWQYMQVGNDQDWMPPSYAYLTVVGNALSRGGRVYTPKAGITSGQVSNIIRPEFEIGSDLSEQWQADDKVNINPIMRLQGGSYIIAGNSTLLLPDESSGTNNVFCESSGDLTVIEIRRFVYNLATELQYQYNSVSAFETFSIRTAKFMEMLKSEGAITDYEVINASSDAEPRKLKVILNVYISPTIKEIEIYLNVQYGSIEIGMGGDQ